MISANDPEKFFRILQGAALSYLDKLSLKLSLANSLPSHIFI